MNSLALATFALALAAVNAGIIAHGHHGVVLQGPSTKTGLVGPDGSHLSGHAPGGQVVHSVDVGYAAHTGHVLDHHHAIPVVTTHHHHHAPAVAHSSISRVDHIHSTPIIAHHHVAHVAPVWGGHADVGHVVLAHHGGHGHDDDGQYRHDDGGHDGLDGHGHEGQYVHDYNEVLYDDGSYKPHLHEDNHNEHHDDDGQYHHHHHDDDYGHHDY